MLKTIHIRNFKCFLDFDLTLESLTLLTGFNGAGKSSSLQPLLLMTQALREAPRTSILSLNGPLTHLGSAGDVVAENVSGEMVLSFADEENGKAAWGFAHDRALERGELRLTSSRFSFGEPSQVIWAPEGKPHSLLHTIGNVIFVGATRGAHGEAQPLPDSASVASGDVGAEGQWAGYWYARLADDPVDKNRRHPTESRETVRGQVDAWMSELFPKARVNAERLTGLMLTKTSFALDGGNELRRPANVGYGLSYAFPIIVALVCAEPGQVIIIDSPEAHLHPRAQSAMGGVLAHFAARGVQIIVESHSDHLVNGVRLAVREKTVTAERVAIHFFGGERDDRGRRSKKIDVRPDGTLEDWPGGFFDQAMTDLLRLS